MRVANTLNVKRNMRNILYAGVATVLLASGMVLAPAFAQSTSDAQTVSQQVATGTYRYKKGKDVSQGYFMRTYKAGGDTYKEKIGVTCDSTASTAPYFILSYQLFKNGKKFTAKQQANIYAKKRVNHMCGLTKDGVLVIRAKAKTHPKATFNYLFEIAKEKNILPFN